MARNKEPDRVLGPYRHGDGWRLVVVRDGDRRYLPYPTKAKADKKKGLLEQALALQTSTVAEAVADYLTWLEKVKGRAPQTLRCARAKLRFFFGEGQETLVSLTPERCAELHERMASRYAVATVHEALGRAKAFLSWLVKRERLKSNPCAEIEPIGKPRRGKRLLTKDQARAFEAACLAEEGEVATACLALLYTGRRISEICRRKVWDLDDNGNALVGIGKGGRPFTATILEPLRTRLLLLAQGKRPEDRLINLCEQTVRRNVKRLAKQAGVPESATLTPHGLRGTFSVLAQRDGGAAAAAVAGALGHSEAINRQHYGGQAAQDEAQGRAVLTVLRGGKAGNDISSESFPRAAKSASSRG